MSTEKRREYWRLYSAKRRQSSKYREQQKNFYREWYRKNGRNRAIDYAEATSEWQRKHPEAVSARGKISRAIKAGKLERPLNCSNCGGVRKISAHHQDYSKPLEVKWLCSSCHKLIHQKSQA